MSQELNNKQAFIAGGRSDIGLAIAKRFAHEVTITAQNQKAIDRPVAEIGANDPVLKKLQKID